MGVSAARLPEEVYTNTLPWWQAALRKKCVAVVGWESEVIGEWQVRSPLSLSLSLSSQHVDPSRLQRSRLGSSYLCCTSHQLWAVGCRPGCTDSWAFSSGSSSELLGGYCNAS